MNRSILLIVSLHVLAGNAAAYTLWNDTRTSALLPDDMVTIRTESPQGGGRVNTLLYRENGVQETPFVSVPDGPSTLEAMVPGPVSQRQYYGFRLVNGDDIDLMSVGLTSGVTPDHTDLTRVADDPVGDETTGRVNLDLTDCRVGRDETRLYAALSNAGGGFPVSSGLTFFSYLLGIKNPAVAEPDTVFALIHTIAVTGIIEPGLYMVYGTGTNDLTKIGEITATELPGEDTLLLSCLWSDLAGDPVFQSWFDLSDPQVDVAGFAQRITLLGGVQEADETPGGVWHLRELALDPGLNRLPQLSDLTLAEADAGGFAQVVYDDLDGHCPVIAELVFDGGLAYPLRPQSLDYSGSVAYRSDDNLPPLATGDWTEAIVRFSDNGTDAVQLIETNLSGVDDAFALQLRAAPNPFSGHTELAFELPSAQSVELSIYDLGGRRIATLVDDVLPAGAHIRTWNGRDDRGRPQAAGVYFYQLRGSGRELLRRVTLLR